MWADVRHQSLLEVSFVDIPLPSTHMLTSCSDMWVSFLLCLNLDWCSSRVWSGRSICYESKCLLCNANNVPIWWVREHYGVVSVLWFTDLNFSETICFECELIFTDCRSSHLAAVLYRFKDESRNSTLVWLELSLAGYFGFPLCG